MGLTSQALWGLSNREYLALRKQWLYHREHQLALLSVLRADLHNTSSRNFGRVFEPADFMPGVSTGIEERMQTLIEQGYSPSEAAAMASSRQSGEHKLRVIDGALSQSHAAKQRRRA